MGNYELEKGTYENSVRAVCQAPDLILGCANWIEKHIHERIQESRTSPMREDETRMRFEFRAEEIYFSNNGKGYLGYYVLHYRDLGYDQISPPSALALAYLVKVGLQKRLPTIPIYTFGGWYSGYINDITGEFCRRAPIAIGDERRGITVDISKEVRLLKTL